MHFLNPAHHSEFTRKIHEKGQRSLDQDISNHSSQYNIFHFPFYKLEDHPHFYNKHSWIRSGSMSDQTISPLFMAHQQMGFLGYVLAITVIYESQPTLRMILPPIKTMLPYYTKAFPHFCKQQRLQQKHFSNTHS